MKNSMKTLLSTIVITSVISFPAVAENAHDHGDKNEGADSGMMMGMMNHDQVMAMHDHMKKMHALMSKIKTETDPDKRQKLMDEHMQVMQDGMQMMNMGNGMKGGKKMDKMDITKRMGRTRSDFFRQNRCNQLPFAIKIQRALNPNQ